jgi:ABC-2 type transport system permease protein
MNQILAIISAKLTMAKHQIASVRHESRLKVSVITISAFFLWLGAYILFHAGFHWLLAFGGRSGGGFNFGDLLMARMLAILSLSIFFLLIFSNILVSFSTLYKSREVSYLLQAPMEFEHFFYARFVECVLFSSWSLAFLGSPLIIAYGINTEASPLFYIAALVFFLPFITLPAALGAIITILLVRIFPRLKMRILLLLAAAVLGFLFLYVRGIIRSTNITEDTLIPAFLDAANRTQSPLLPGYQAVQGILAAAAARFGDSLFWFLVLLSSAMMAVWTGGMLSRRLFYPGWSYLMGQDRQRIIAPDSGILNRIEKLIRPLRNPGRSLIMKDIRLFWRDPAQWSQFMIFFGIMAIYIANLRNTSRFYEQEIWRSWIACLNVGALSLILATLTSRFIFPLVSLEGRRFWILGLAPLTWRQLLWQKFAMSVCTTSGFTVGLAALSGYLLRLEPVYFALTLYSIVIINFGLSGLAVGLGALYPTFTEDNPARIVSGMGGTLNLLISVGYITLVVIAQTLILQWRILERFTSPGWFQTALAIAVLFMTLLTAFCTFLPMRLGLHNLKEMEF